MSGKRPVYAVDLPGFGFSERSDRRYTPELYTTAILALLDEIEQVEGGVDVVALSLSGEFVARAAQRRPELFHALILIAPSGFSAARQINRTEQVTRSQTSERTRRFVTFPLWSQALFDLLVTKPSIIYYLKRSFVGPIDDGLLAYDYATTHQPGARFAPLSFISGALFTPTFASQSTARSTSLHWCCMTRARLLASMNCPHS
jgi:pimeloyl-ACP methyl ester carboxylesterase